ncbi:hypothetical protein HFK18_14925|uniref:hypothetical protein n=1 Tax=Stenotrophomonas sp. SbOxS2 TaxID=2723885 RepID=UPI0015D1B3C8|nr:hypothetical protein [Stenotrophomonas sp. SbOxS2]MCI1120112.1 hypothetical protein [Stenotrophomonas maltophilia]NYT99763.1 hypothetical protein [Stenotrophomonas sp. SbOxS2]
MIEVYAFTDDQKKFLARIVDDLGGPTSTGNLLHVIENLLYALKPDWQLATFGEDTDVRADLEVCMAALGYLKVQNVATAK